MSANEMQVIECPQCGARHKMLKPKSKLKTYEIYSDGKTISPELNDALEVAACVKCDVTFWIEDAQVAKVDVAEDMPSLKAPSIGQYEQLLNADVVTTDEEEILRMELLWAFNDRVRGGYPLFQNDGDQAAWEANVVALAALLDTSEPYSRLLKAEIARERGDFDAAEAILSKIKEGHLVSIKRQMLEAVHDRKKEVIKFQQ